MAAPLFFLAPIAAFIGGIASKLFTGITELYFKKFAIHTVLILFFVSMYSGFMLAIKSLSNQLDISSIPQFLINGFLILPSNIDTCISIIVSAELIKLSLKIQSKILSIRKS